MQDANCYITENPIFSLEDFSLRTIKTVEASRTLKEEATPKQQALYVSQLQDAIMRNIMRSVPLIRPRLNVAEVYDIPEPHYIL